MAPDQAAPVPAGWYPDPYGASELRWWDGQNWTESIHPPVAAPPAAPEPAPPAQEPVAQQPVAQEPVIQEPLAPEFAAQQPPVQEFPVQQPPVQQPPVQQPPVQPPPALNAPEQESATHQPEPQYLGVEALQFQEAPVEAPQAQEPQAQEPQEPAPPLVTPPVSAPPEGELHATGLPSRRELRARSAEQSGGPLSASTSAPTPALPSTDIPDASAPTAFDWLTTGSVPQPPAAAPAFPAPEPVQADADPFAAHASPAPFAAPDATPESAAASAGATEPPGSGPVPVAATSAWAHEPQTVTPDPDELYPATSSRTSTVSGWLIASMPLMTGIFAIAAVKAQENYPRYVPAGLTWWMLAGGVLAAAYIATIILALTDRRKLDWAGYNRPAHWYWAILTAPVYLAIRTIAVRRETGRNSMMLWVWLILAAALVGAWFAAKTFAPELVNGYVLPFL